MSLVLVFPNSAEAKTRWGEN